MLGYVVIMAVLIWISTVSDYYRNQNSVVGTVTRLWPGQSGV